MIKHKMRKINRQLSREESIEILAKAEYGVLATISSDGCPYATPISYVHHGGNIYFHSAKSGHKIDNFQHDANVSFAVVGETEPVFDDFFSTYYESVIIFGRISEVTEAPVKTEILLLFAEKYLSEHMAKANDAIQRTLPAVSIWLLRVEHMTGKAKRRK